MKTATIVVLLVIAVPIAIAIAFNFDSLFGMRELSGPIAIVDKSTLERGYIGISFGPVSSEDAEGLGIDGSVTVTEVLPGSPADEAGIATGDIVVQVDRADVADVEEFMSLARDWKPRETVTLHVLREGAAIQVDVQLMTFEEMHGLKEQSSENRTTVDPVSAHQLWAQALWSSIPSNQVPGEEARKLYVAALTRAQRKAPIYVSLGDFDSGPVPLRESFQELVQGVEERLTDGTETQPQRILPDLELPGIGTTASNLHRILTESYRKAQQNAMVKGVEELAQFLREGSASSELYYRAAIAEDPRHLPAWFRLAKGGKGDEARADVDGFMRNDPENAMPHYLGGALFAKAGDLPSALKAVQMGNAKSRCAWYPADLPSDFELSYPDTEEFRTLGVSGERIPPTALAYLLKRVDDAFNFAEPYPDCLRELGYSLVDEGKRLEAAGKTAEAADCFEAVIAMGASLIRAEPRDSYLMVVGLSVCGLPLDDLQSLYERQEDQKKRVQLEQFRAQWKKFHGKFADAVRVLDPSDEELKLLLLGRKDGLAEERKQLDRILRESGFLDELAIVPLGEGHQ